MSVFLDTSVAIAILDETDMQHAWSKAEFANWKERGPIIISDIVYSEWSAGMKDKQEIDRAVGILGLERMRFTDNALFDAGKAFLKYKRDNNGPKSNVLSDFLIGALAANLNVPLITTNPKDFKKYFPDICVVCP